MSIIPDDEISVELYNSSIENLKYDLAFFLKDLNSWGILVPSVSNFYNSSYGEHVVKFPVLFSRYQFPVCSVSF